MQIPKQIKVGAKKYKIVQPKHMSRRGILGSTYYDHELMLIATHSAATGRKRSDHQRSETFWHELTHAILKDMDSSLEGDEKFVTAFSQRLNDAIRSAKF